MFRSSTLALALAFATLPVLVACSNQNDTGTVPAQGDSPQTALGKAAKQAIDEAREELARSNINLNNEFHIDGNQIIAKTSDKASGDPRANAELTPQGDLLLDGKKVETTPAQHALLVQYRQQIVGVAETGMALGVQGADLGGKAIGAVFDGLLSGNPDQIEARIEAAADKLEAEAMRLCKQLPALLTTQQALAASLPEFKPYATMKQSDIDDCRTHDGFSDADRAEVRAEVRDQVRNATRTGIRDEIRNSIRDAAQTIGIASSGTGDTIEVNGIHFLLPPGGVSTNTSNGNARIEVSNGLQVKLVDGELWINDARYPAPKAGGEVDLRTTGTVKVDGAVVSAI